MKRAFITHVFAAAFGAVVLLASSAMAQSTAFTYQGRLNAAGAATNGLHDFRFLLYTAATGGVVVGSPVCADDVEVVDGVFTVQLDFGALFGATSDRYLEIAVRQDTGLPCADLTGFASLTPRHAITATPRAIHANSAYALDAADGVPTNAVYVDAEGRVGVGTTTPITNIHVKGTAPSMVLQDMASASNQAGYVSYRNDASVETAWVGFGTTGSPHFSIVNARAGGNINLEAITITSAGAVGIGTGAPSATLDVRGDIRLGSTGQYQAAVGDEKLRIVRGRISSAGAILNGSGFTASRSGTGLYSISYSGSFSGTPVLTVSPHVASTGGPYCAHINGVTTVAAGVRITTASGTNIDDTFDFILIGAR